MSNSASSFSIRRLRSARGTPITFSGFNQIDFNQILNLVMQQERRPVAALETQKSTLETQRTQLSTLAGKLSNQSCWAYSRQVR